VIYKTIKQGDGQKVKPWYRSKKYIDFCEEQKQRGLQKKYWKELSKMWKAEQEFRKDFEAALNKFAEPE